MKLLFRTTVFLLPVLSEAITVAEFRALNSDKKIEILEAIHELEIDTPADLLQIYTIGLRDESEDVQLVVARLSAFLTGGLQSEKLSGGTIPTFPIKDSDEFQQALVALLSSKNIGIRASVVAALAYSSSPNQELETLLLDHFDIEDSDEVRGSIIEAMGQIDYQSKRLVNAALELMNPEKKSEAAFQAGSVLGLLKSDDALPLLMKMASQKSSTQDEALLALAAYGNSALQARKVIVSIIEDENQLQEIRNLARMTLESIEGNTPKETGLKKIGTADLWPLALRKSGQKSDDRGQEERRPGENLDGGSAPISHDAYKGEPPSVRGKKRVVSLEELFLWLLISGGLVLLGVLALKVWKGRR